MPSPQLTLGPNDNKGTLANTPKPHVITDGSTTLFFTQASGTELDVYLWSPF